MKIIIEYYVTRKNSTTHIVETVDCEHSAAVIDATRDAFRLIASYNDQGPHTVAGQQARLIKIEIAN